MHENSQDLKKAMTAGCGGVLPALSKLRQEGGLSTGGQKQPGKHRKTLTPQPKEVEDKERKEEQERKKLK